MELMMIGLGGAVGSCLRYGISKAAMKLGWVFPMGTLLCNVLAGVAIGFVMGLESQSVVIPARTKLLITTGLLGGLSTFSAFSMETVRLYAQGNYWMAVGNVILNVSLSLIGVIGGITLARLIKKA